MDQAQRRAWLERRRQGVGSSDAAALVGLSPYKTALEVWVEKVHGYDEGDQRNLREKKWGLKLEEVLAAAYTEETGQVAAPLADELYLHDSRPWMIATPDRIVTPGGKLVELKTVSAFADNEWGTPGTDEVPEGYLVQVQHQMEVMGADVCDVAVLVGGNDFRIYTINRRQQLIDDLVEIEYQFWQTVLARQPPPPDWSAAGTARLVQRLHVPEDGADVDLDEAHVPLVEEYLACGQRVKEEEARRERAKAELCEAMGVASTAFLPDGRRISRKLVKRKAYEVNACEYYNFMIHNKKG